MSNSSISNQLQSKTKGRAVEQIDILSGEVLARFGSQSEAAHFTNVNKSNISSVCNGKLASAGGFKWRFCTLDGF